MLNWDGIELTGAMETQPASELVDSNSTKEGPVSGSLLSERDRQLSLTKELVKAGTEDVAKHISAKVLNESIKEGVLENAKFVKDEIFKTASSIDKVSLGTITYGVPTTENGLIPFDGRTVTDKELAKVLTASPIDGVIIAGDSITLPDWRGHGIVMPGALEANGLPGQMIPDTTRAHAHQIATATGNGTKGFLQGDTIVTDDSTELSAGGVTRGPSVLMFICIVGTRQLNVVGEIAGNLEADVEELKKKVEAFDTNSPEDVIKTATDAKTAALEALTKATAAEVQNQSDLVEVMNLKAEVAAMEAKLATFVPEEDKWKTPFANLGTKVDGLSAEIAALENLIAVKAVAAKASRDALETELKRQDDEFEAYKGAISVEQTLQDDKLSKLIPDVLQLQKLTTDLEKEMADTRASTQKLTKVRTDRIDSDRVLSVERKDGEKKLVIKFLDGIDVEVDIDTGVDEAIAELTKSIDNKLKVINDTIRDMKQKDDDLKVLIDANVAEIATLKTRTGEVELKAQDALDRTKVNKDMIKEDRTRLDVVEPLAQNAFDKARVNLNTLRIVVPEFREGIKNNLEAIAKNKVEIEKNDVDIAKNAVDIGKNTVDIKANFDEIEKLKNPETKVLTFAGPKSMMRDGTTVLVSINRMVVALDLPTGKELDTVDGGAIIDKKSGLISVDISDKAPLSISATFKDAVVTTVEKKRVRVVEVVGEQYGLWTFYDGQKFYFGVDGGSATELTFYFSEAGGSKRQWQETMQINRGRAESLLCSPYDNWFMEIYVTAKGPGYVHFTVSDQNVDARLLGVKATRTVSIDTIK